MSRTSLSLVVFAALTLTACGNAPPSVDALTVDTPVKGTDGNWSMNVTVTVSDPNVDKIPRIAISGTGPAMIQAQSISIPNGAAGTYPIKLTLVGTAPVGEYTLSVVAYDEPGLESAAKTAKFSVQ